MKISYEHTAVVLLGELDERTRDVVARRFGLQGSKGPETLESIGTSHKITRERVRQIVLQGLREAQAAAEARKRELALLDLYEAAHEALKARGNVRREDLLLEELSAQTPKQAVLFLLELVEGLERHRETDEHYAYWTNASYVGEEIPRALRVLTKELERRRRMLSDEELAGFQSKVRLAPAAFVSSLEVSKFLLKGYDGRWGLHHWPEVSPRGVREKAYLVLKRTRDPLHFTEIAKGIELLQQELPHMPQRPVLAQTVHNELIKDGRFVLVGRGIYALAESGYIPGTVKDVLCSLLAKTKGALERDEILRRIAAQRQVKESTVFLNLQDRTLFGRDSMGRYFLQNSKP